MTAPPRLPPSPLFPTPASIAGTEEEEKISPAPPPAPAPADDADAEAPPGTTAEPGPSDVAAAADPTAALPATAPVDPADPMAPANVTLDCPAGLVGRVIGKGGETIKGLQAQSGAHITIDQNFPEGQPRKIAVSGPKGCVDVAAKMIKDLLEGGPPSSGAGMLVGPGQVSQAVECPKEMVGRIIGKGGETIKGLQTQTGARLQIDQTGHPCKVIIAGNPQCVDAAVAAVSAIIAGQSAHQYNAPPGMGASGAYGMAHAGGYGMPGGYGAPVGYGAPGGYGGYAHAAPGGYGGYPGYGSYGGYGAPAAGGYGGYDPAAATAAAAATATAADGGGADGASQWQALDDGQGHTYYYNAATGVSQWEKPPGM